MPASILINGGHLLFNIGLKVFLAAKKSFLSGGGGDGGPKQNKLFLKLIFEKKNN